MELRPVSNNLLKINLLPSLIPVLSMTTEAVVKEEEPAKSTVKVSYLEGLRGLAAFAVLFRHTNQVVLFKLQTTSSVMFLLFSHSTLATAVFFTLSGRVIANSILKRPTFQVAFDTAVRRVFRLVIPCFWIWTMHWANQRLGVYDIIWQSTTLVDLNRSPFSLWDIIGSTWNMFVYTRSNDEYTHLKGFLNAWFVNLPFNCFSKDFGGRAG